MYMELINIAELKNIVVRQSYDYNHAGFLEALRARYPRNEFFLVATRGKWSRAQQGLIDTAGKRVSDDFKSWVTAEYDAAGQNARAVWEKHRASGLLLTEFQGTTIYIASPFSSPPHAFMQIEINLVHEVVARYAFDSELWGALNDLDDLLHPFTALLEEWEISPYQYQFSRMTNIRRFCQEMVSLEIAKRRDLLPEMERKSIRVIPIQAGNKSADGPDEVSEIPFLEMFPDWMDRPKNEMRFFLDWEESSAGRTGARFCEHWFLQLRDYKNSEGKREMGFTPQWADADGGLDLPEISSPNRDDVYGVMARLEKFDARVGYPFAWYFYMLHGNRIDYTVGQTVARGLRAGKILLPECDERVLLRWAEREYGF